MQKLTLKLKIKVSIFTSAPTYYIHLPAFLKYGFSLQIQITEYLFQIIKKQQPIKSAI